jgi:hypothetical protein
MDLVRDIKKARVGVAFALFGFTLQLVAQLVAVCA